MSTTTPNFGWTVPTSTDYVKDGAAAIETLGDSIDASLVDLKGGTTGQVLAKNTNADMDFVWTTPQVGDITEVTAGTGISGGGTSGAVTITNSMATAIDAKGDLVAGTGADAFARLAVGSNGHVLTADSTTATGLKWAANSQKIVQVVFASTNTFVSSSSTTYADTTLTATITPTSASNQVLVYVAQNGLYRTNGNGNNGITLRLLRGATELTQFAEGIGFTGTTLAQSPATATTMWLDSPATTSATTYKTQYKNTVAAAAVYAQNVAVSTIVLIEVAP